MRVKEAVGGAVTRAGRVATRVGEHLSDTQLVDFKDPNWPEQVVEIAGLRHGAEEAAAKQKQEKTLFPTS